MPSAGCLSVTLPSAACVPASGRSGSRCWRPAGSQAPPALPAAPHHNAPPPTPPGRREAGSTVGRVVGVQLSRCVLLGATAWRQRRRRRCRAAPTHPPTRLQRQQVGRVSLYQLPNPVVLVIQAESRRRHLGDVVPADVEAQQAQHRGGLGLLAWRQAGAAGGGRRRPVAGGRRRQATTDRPALLSNHAVAFLAHLLSGCWRLGAELELKSGRSLECAKPLR